MDGILDTLTQSLNLQTLSLEKVIQVVALILVGWLLIRVLMKLVDRLLARSHGLERVAVYIRSGARIALWVLLGLMVAGTLNLDVTSLIAMLSVVGLAVSLALQNTLSNLAGGILLLVSKPFSVGDYIETDHGSGTVTEVGLAYTKLATPDNKGIFIPNSLVSAARITNYSALGRRRLELLFSASYDDGTEQVKEAVMEVLRGVEELLPDPAPTVNISAYKNSCVEYVVRAWVGVEDYWKVYYRVMEEVRESFRRHGVEMTYDHLNVHLMKE